MALHGPAKPNLKPSNVIPSKRPRTKIRPNRTPTNIDINAEIVRRKTGNFAGPTLLNASDKNNWFEVIVVKSEEFGP